MGRYKFKNHWNYRVVTRLITRKIGVDMSEPGNSKLLPDERLFSITEVYYNSDGKPDSYIEPDKNRLDSHESIEDIKWTLKKMKKALKKPVLDLDNFPSEYVEK